MKTPQQIVLLNHQLYITGIIQLNEKKMQTKFKNAQNALITTNPHKTNWDNSEFCFFNFGEIKDEKQARKFAYTQYFISLCVIKKLTSSQINVMLGVERGLQLRGIAVELGITVSGVNHHLKKIKNLLGANSNNHALLVIKQQL